MTLIRLQRILHEAWIANRQLLIALLGWLVGFPLTGFIRRKPGLTLVIGRRGPVFADNSKYFFVYATQQRSKDERVVFLTGDRALAANITDAGGEAVVHPSWHSLNLVLRCRYVVVDMADWFDFAVYPLSRGARVVQIWHGAPLKHIELDLHRERLTAAPLVVRPMIRMQKVLLGRYPVYDSVVSTSQQFVNQAFRRCFKAQHFLGTGYPRNDILLQRPAKGSVADRLARINMDEQALDAVAAVHSRGWKVALYVPTFRKDMAAPFEHDLDLVRWSVFACENKLLILIKLHPFMHGQYQINQHLNLLEYAPLGDVYPLMAQCDLLITDYSSIYFDFLLLDRPIVFFAYDLEGYLSQDRQMYFSYDSMTPGQKCRTQAELEHALSEILVNGCQDDYVDQRAIVRHFTHDYVDHGSAIRLLDSLKAADESCARVR